MAQKFDVLAELSRSLENDIKRAEADLKQEMDWLRSGVEEIERKLTDYTADPTRFSEDLNIGEKAARVQAASAVLATLIERRNQLKGLMEFASSIAGK